MSNEMYFLYKEGNYGQGVFWLGCDLEEGKREADKAASLDRDDYHDWELRKLGKESDRDYTTRAADFNEVVYTGIRTVQKP